MDSDEEICLSEHALKALNEFYLEKEKNTPVMGAVEEDWYFQELKEKLTSKECIVLADFAENYTFTIQDEIRSYHWNNNQQATKHPFVYYYKKDTKVCCRNLCIISDHLVHYTIAVHTFQKHLIDNIKNITPSVIEKVIYFTNGSNSQYKNKKNYLNELSQFWYDKNTAVTLANIALKAADKDGRIACISCPTVYAHLLDICRESDNIYLFEYDKRFQDLYQEHFVHYDYNNPLKVPEMFKSYFEVVLVDPPYLSEECLEKTLQTVKYVAKDKIILCTGAAMEDLAYKLLTLKSCNFKPQHERKLGNEFKCYSNWNLDDLINIVNINYDKYTK